MATALEGDQDKTYDNRGGDAASIADDSADDFELISDASLADASKVISIASEYGSRGDNGIEETLEDQERVHAIDPLSAFEMIQSEHRLLKGELESQNELLHRRVEAMEAQEQQNMEQIAALKDAMDEQERQKAEEVAALKKDLETLSLELSEKKAQQSDMESQIKFFKESSEKADVLTANLLQAEEVVKAQDIVIQQMRNDGYSGPPPLAPALSMDQRLVEELAKKDELIKRMESALGSMNGERLKAQHDAGRFAEMNQDMQELIEALQSQADADKAEWNAVRSDLEKQIQVLSDRVIAFEDQYSGASMAQAGPNENVDTPTLRHRDAQERSASPASLSASIHWVECQRCHLPMATAGPHPCPALIDLLD